jgi:polar amino acid transport system substrate-binding protein
VTGRRAAIAALAAAMALAVAGCGSSSDAARNAALAALATLPPAAPSASATTPPARCGTASLRPPRDMPKPGAMPAGSFMESIRRSGRLVAGVDQNTLLFGYLKPSTARIEGFEVDLLHEIARAIFGDPNRIELKALTTAQRSDAVRSGSVDIVADAFTITCARRREVAFSTVYYDAGQRVLVRADSPARGLSDLGGKRVCATAGSTSLGLLKRSPAKPIPFPVAQRTDCLVALQEGRVAAISTDDSFLLGFKAQDPNTKIVGPRLADEPYGMAIAHGHPEFVRFVNSVLERLRRDGEWKAIHRRWIGRVAPTPAPPRPEYSR